MPLAETNYSRKMKKIKDIRYIPFDQLFTSISLANNTSEYKQTCDNFAKLHKFKNQEHIAPQLLALVAELESVMNCSKLCAQRTVAAAMTTSNKWLAGCLYFMQYATRSSFINNQSSTPGTYYCALVPLILAGFKKYQNIDYKSWDPTTLGAALDVPLAEAVGSFSNFYTLNQGNWVPKHQPHELLEFRTAGLRDKLGVPKNPKTTYKLNTGALSAAPWLLQVMLTQIWCAHPSNRNQYMILSPNYDLPEPLISTQLW